MERLLVPGHELFQPLDGAVSGESSISSGLLNASRIRWNLSLRSTRAIPRPNFAQWLKSSASNSCIITYGTNRLVSKSALIAVLTLADRASSTDRALSGKGSVAAAARPGHAPEPVRGMP